MAERPLISVHNGLPARYLAEDLPITDPISLLISHDQGVQALLRSNGIGTEFSLTDGWRSEHASRQAFALLWTHLAGVWAKPWMQIDGDETARLAGLPPFREDQDPETVYDGLVVRLVEHPMFPRRVLAAANLGRFATSDDPTDDLQAHKVLAEDPDLSGRVVPTFSPDRYLDPARPGWRTDADLLAEVTGVGTEDVAGFLEALQQRRSYFISRGAISSEHHSSDVPIARLSPREASRLYRLARSAEVLPAEALALEGHLLWEAGRMATDDGLVMGLFPPAGFSPGPTTRPGRATGVSLIGSAPCWPTSAQLLAFGCSSSPSTPTRTRRKSCRWPPSTRRWPRFLPLASPTIPPSCARSESRRSPPRAPAGLSAWSMT